MTAVAADPKFAAAYESRGVGSIVGQALKPLGGFGKFLLVLSALSIIGCNLVNNYSMADTLPVLSSNHVEGAALYMDNRWLGNIYRNCHCRREFFCGSAGIMIFVGHWVHGNSFLMHCAYRILLFPQKEIAVGGLEQHESHTTRHCRVLRYCDGLRGIRSIHESDVVCWRRAEVYKAPWC